MNAFKYLPLVVLAILAIGFSGCFIAVSETEHVIITEFGKIKGEPISEPGLRFKLPFIQKVHRIEKRLLNWDGRPIEIPTRDKAYISVNTFARWRITDPARFFLRLRDNHNAASKLEDILGSETRNLIASHELIEVVRTDKNRTPTPDETIQAALEEEQSGGTKIGELPPIRVGRVAIEEQIKRNATPKLAEFGIDLLDVRLKRVNYNNEVLLRVYQRMISERLQIAQRFRSEGEAEAARIGGNRERDLQQIESEAYRKVQEIRGQADAEASQIYADAYGSTAGAGDFYRFLKGLETLRKSVSADSTLMLSTDSELFRLLKSAGDPGQIPSPDQIPALPEPAPDPVPVTPLAPPDPVPAESAPADQGLIPAEAGAAVPEGEG